MVIFFVKVLVICLLIGNGTSTPVAEYDKSSRYEEYIIEHEISSGSAKNAVIAMNLSSIEIPPGCQKCNAKEERYCLGADLISDHCCCDKRYHELFPYIPHTCYFGTQLCQTVASDCTEYHRLRTCCCQKLTLHKFLEDEMSTTESSEIVFHKEDLITVPFTHEKRHAKKSEFVLMQKRNFKQIGLYSHVIGAPVNVVSGGIANPFFSNALDLFRGADFRRRCPVCDPSVYSYCTDKLFHDSCCCHNPNNPYGKLRINLEKLKFSSEKLRINLEKLKFKLEKSKINLKKSKINLEKSITNLKRFKLRQVKDNSKKPKINFEKSKINFLDIIQRPTLCKGNTRST
ncbi:unnamed protein product [Psylliodes chrysocephalus]|uniref:CCC domain-containing protein n=1 Tax=Psylliodes chrysocephalus TaxID=3402493 RepID=A0A9P0D6G8_9CUCU|nr:unnamed protein product [Psylliodes chrysocephala]